MVESAQKNSILHVLVPAVLAAGVALAANYMSGSIIAWMLLYPLWMLLSLYSTRKAKKTRHFVLSLAGVSIGFYLFMMGFLPGFADLLLMPLVMIMLLPYILDHFFYRHKPDSVSGTLIFPAAWVTCTMIDEAFSFGIYYHAESLQFDNTVFIQAASVIGGRGLCFLILWIVSLLCFIAVQGRRGFRKETGIAGIAAVLAVAAVYVFGLVSLNTGREAQRTVRVAYSAGPYIGDYTTEISTPAGEAAECILNNVEYAARESAVLLAYSEESFAVSDTVADELIALTREVAKENHIAVLLAMEITPTRVETGTDKLRNCLIFVDNTGEVRGEYDKNKLIPLLESINYISGSEKPVCVGLETDEGMLNLSFAICYDGDFSDYVAAMDSDTELFILPSWDWIDIDALHYRDVAVRFVENGVPILKPTYDGTGIAADARGRVIALFNTAETGFGKASVVDIPLNGYRTLYRTLRIPLNILYPVIAFTGLAAALLRALRSRKKQKSAANV